MDDWDDACAFACTLPGVTLESWWGTPCPKVSGKGLMSRSREADSFGLMVTRDEKLLLLETDPDTFWQTDHYRNYSMLLVRFGTDSRERIELYINRAWWDRAPKATRAAFGERP
jgi:hypothetical protein